MTTPNTIQADSLATAIPANCQIIDVREPDEFAFESLPNTKNIPLSQIERGVLYDIPRDGKLLVICQSGGRSARATTLLAQKGYTNIINAAGGINAFKKAGGALVCERKTLPLMRQVQIAAGGLVTLGMLLAHFVNPAFIYLSGFVGVGLALAGLTGTCPMGAFLARMPWNKEEESTGSRCQ